MPTAEKDAAASDQALALTNSLSIKATPIEARIIELKMKRRSNDIILWIARLRANGANGTDPVHHQRRKGRAAIAGSFRAFYILQRTDDIEDAHRKNNREII